MIMQNDAGARADIEKIFREKKLVMLSEMRLKLREVEIHAHASACAELLKRKERLRLFTFLSARTVRNVAVMPHAQGAPQDRGRSSSYCGAAPMPRLERGGRRGPAKAAPSGWEWVESKRSTECRTAFGLPPLPTQPPAPFYSPEATGDLPPVSQGEEERRRRKDSKERFFTGEGSALAQVLVKT
jgi:hypothetical protein